MQKSDFESLYRVLGSYLASRVLIVDTFSARAVIWRASTVTPLQKMPTIDTLDALEEHEEHKDNYQTNSN